MLLLHMFLQVSPVGGLHYNGELHPIPTPQDGLAVSIPVISSIEYKSVNFQHMEQEMIDIVLR